MKKFLKVVLGVVVTLLVLGAIGVGVLMFTANKAVESVDHAIKQEQKKVENKDELLAKMLEKAPKPVVTRDEYSYTVEYTLTNDTKEDFDYIQISYDVFDKQGVKLSNDFTNITDIKAGQVFKLKLDLYQEGAESYKVTGISSNPLD